MIKVFTDSGKSYEIPGADLVAAMGDLGGPLTVATGEDGALCYQADVDVQYSGHERPVWFRGELVGFAEKLGEARRGSLVLEEETLAFHSPEVLREWPLMELRAVQTSSSALQISPVGGGLVQFRFLADSPKRWEDLLRHALKAAYKKRGRGEILEFQPRIVVGP